MNGRIAAPRQPGVIWWLPLVLIAATEYKFRRRTNDEALSGSLDFWTAAELGVYAVVGCYLLLCWRPRLRPHVAMVWLVGYMMSTAVSALYAPFPVLASARAVQLVIILLAIIQWIDVADIAMVRRFIHAYIVMITVSILIGLAYVAPTTVRQEGRFTWVSTHSVVAGLMLAISCTLLFGMWLTHRIADLPWRRWAYGGLFAFHLVALVRTRTRGSLGAVIVALLIMALLWLDTRGRRDLMLVSTAVVAFVALSVWQPLFAYVNRGEDAAQLGTFNRRTEIWSLAYNTFLERPLHGLGFTAARGVFFDETGLGGAHNALVNVVIDLGAVGLFWWLGLIAITIVGLRRLRHRLGRAARPHQFEIITIAGVTACQLVNGMTTESLGAAIGVGAMFLYVVVGWVVVVTDAVADDITSGEPAADQVLEAIDVDALGGADPHDVTRVE